MVFVLVKTPQNCQSVKFKSSSIFPTCSSTILPLHCIYVLAFGVCCRTLNSYHCMVTHFGYHGICCSFIFAFGLYSCLILG